MLQGIISGVIEGIVLVFGRRSHIVSGLAVGLTHAILTKHTDFGAFDIFLTAGFSMGLIQLALGIY
jgi:hypothetical protein